MNLGQVTAVAILATLLFYGAVAVCLGEVTDEQGVRCIIGEGADQGIAGLEALADALQNRGHTNGVYGCKAKHIDKEPALVWKMAKSAWFRAKNVNPTNGATHWESVRFKKPYWASSMVKTVLIKDHQFYKEK